jgi:hypothetical protein
VISDMATWPRCRHDREICSECIVVDDAAKRFSDGVSTIITLSPLAERARSWLAVRLADGQVDFNLYPSKKVAIAHQSNEKLCAFICLRNIPTGLSRKDAAIWLQLHRYMYDHGANLTDPDEREVIMPQGRDQKLTRLVIPSDGMGRHIRRYS